MRYALAVLVPAVISIVIASACGGASNVATQSLIPSVDGGGVYIALGDSIAAGEGASDPEGTDYVARLVEAIGEASGDAPELQDLAVGGHTTQDLIDTQLSRALGRLAQGDVRLVTITIGGNDLFQYSADADCVRDPVDPGCPLEAGLFDVERNLDRILGDLRMAAPELPIVMNVYPQLFSGSGHDFEYQAEKSFDLLNGVILSVADRHDVLIADPGPRFQGRSRDLTHIDDEPIDFHPNDAGYRVISDAFLESLGLPTSGNAPLQ